MQAAILFNAHLTRASKCLPPLALPSDATGWVCWQTRPAASAVTVSAAEAEFRILPRE